MEFDNQSDLPLFITKTSKFISSRLRFWFCIISLVQVYVQLIDIVSTSEWKTESRRWGSEGIRGVGIAPIPPGTCCP